jgi:transcriptional regulator with XRE-family HTH domain
MDVIGQKLRAARQGQRMSLRALAARADVSVSLLSQIENGKSTPSVRSLQSIADALAVPLGYFFPGDESNGLAPAAPAPLTEAILRAPHRPRLELNDGIVWMRLTPQEEKDAQFLELLYQVGASSGAKMSHHRGREFGLVLEGELTVEIGVQKHLLRAGDSIIFDSTHPHRLVNTGTMLMRAIWVVMNHCSTARS